MDIQNANGDDNFYEIIGLSGITLTNVQKIYAYSGSSPIFPSIICSKFPNLKKIVFNSRSLKTLTGSSFSGCILLEVLELNSNQISSVASNTFEKNTKLKEVKMNYQGGKLTSLPQEVFWNLKELTALDLGSNSGINFPSYVFHNLTSLTWLNVGDCGLLVWNQFWFSDLASLKYLTISSNSLTSIPRFAFHKDAQLKSLNINYNFIKRLSRNSFYLLTSFTEIFAMNNLINEIEKAIFDDASINTAYFSNNQCVDTNTFNVAYFANCFTNYDTRTIDVTTSGSDYEWFSISMCRMNVSIKAEEHAEIMFSNYQTEHMDPHALLTIDKVESQTRNSYLSTTDGLVKNKNGFFLDAEEGRYFNILLSNNVINVYSGISVFQYMFSVNYAHGVKAFGVRTKNSVGYWTVKIDTACT